jgi:hypothetical protein
MTDLMTVEWKRRMKSSKLGFLRFEPPSDGLPFVTDRQRNDVKQVMSRFLLVVGLKAPETLVEVQQMEKDAILIDFDFDTAEEGDFVDEMASFAQCASGISNEVFHTAFYEIAVISANEVEVTADQYVEIVNDAYIDTLDSIYGFSGSKQRAH